MADKKILGKRQTVRERAASGPKRRLNPLKHVRSRAGKVGKGAKRVSAFGGREYHLPLPDNRLGRIGKKRVRLIPRFVRNSWAEIRLVEWPNRRETRRLTTAVIIFSIIFGVSIALLDYGLDKLFKEIIVKK